MFVFNRLFTLQFDSSKSGAQNDNEGDIYYLPSEVAIHNKPDDLWVTYLHSVYDLTELCTIWKDSQEIKPIIAHAGKDISHWFDYCRHDIKYHVHRVTGALVPFCPHGPIPDVGIVSPLSTWRPLDSCPWWLHDKYKKGNLTKTSRPCRIINTLTGCKVIISVGKWLNFSVYIVIRQYPHSRSARRIH